MRLIRKKHKLDHSASPFTPNKVSETLNANRNSTAVCPYGLTALQLHPWDHFVCYIYAGSLTCRTYMTASRQAESVHSPAIAEAWQTKGAGSPMLADNSSVPRHKTPGTVYVTPPCTSYPSCSYQAWF